MADARRAVIDVGTNSVKLLVADIKGRVVHPVLEAGNQTRLGKGFYDTHRLQPDAIRSTATAVAKFAEAARTNKAEHIRVFATSAARDALNADDLITAVDRAAGLKLEVISGEQEAEWAFRGATSDPKLSREPILLLDVGGGSTEFILGQGERVHLRHSFPLGAVRLMETIPHSDPPQAAELAATRDWLRNFLDRQVRPALGPALKHEVQLHARHHRVLLVGTGGAATVLARMQQQMSDYDRERIEAVRLTRKLVADWMDRLWTLSLAERKKIVGLPPERADVALTGSAIYESVMEAFAFAELRVTTRGLRFAAVLHPSATSAA